MRQMGTSAHPPGMTRRSFVHLLTSFIAAPIWPQTHAAARDKAWFGACQVDRTGIARACVFDSGGRPIRSIKLPTRGHDLIARPGSQNQEIIAFARRPGNFAVSFQCSDNRAVPKWFSAPLGRHFYGHGVFSGDGKVLYCTENDIETGNGVIGCYDATNNYQLVDSLPSGGIGPHDIALAIDNRTLIVANGGVRTHPDYGRRALNLGAIDSNITFVDRLFGAPLMKLQTADVPSQLSLRHMAVSSNGDVFIGAQHKGPKFDRPPLLFRIKTNQTIESINLPGYVQSNLKNYVTSICCSSDGSKVGLTSAKGNCAYVIDPNSGKVRANRRLHDAAGIAFAESRCVATSGNGRLIDPISGTDINQIDTSWDNHVAALL